MLIDRKCCNPIVIAGMDGEDVQTSAVLILKWGKMEDMMESAHLPTEIAIQ